MALRWPVVFLYPQYGQSDFVQSMGERDLMAAPMGGMPARGTCPYWIDGCYYVEMVFDSGAQDNISSEVIEKYLTNVRPSKKIVGGAIGSRRRGRRSVAFARA